jgi:hypothetical protein
MKHQKIKKSNFKTTYNFSCILFFGIYVTFVFLQSGCVKNNPAPVFIEINTWSLVSNPESLESPGALTQNFDNAWVYIDDKLIGVFELPCTVPVILDGTKKVRIYPAIRNNGQQSSKKIYPFVTPFETTETFVAGNTYTFNPITMYYKNVDFWIEDFESATIKFETVESVSNAELVRESLSEISAWGDYGHVALSSTENTWTGLSFGNQYLPVGQEVYLEINYRNTTGISTALNAYDINDNLTERPNWLINKQEPSDLTWKKIYIDLRELVSYSTNADYFKQRLRCTLDSDKTEADVYIDNIKVVHF